MDPESFDRGGLLLTMFLFLVYESREDPNITISGPSLVRQRNASFFFVLFFFFFFWGGGGGGVVER